MDKETFRLIAATRNEGKIRELRDLWEGLPIDLHGLSGFANIVDVEETGKTFLENAKLKASGYAAQCQAFTMADDSGLEVDALGNRPGVRSARYAGSQTSYPEKIEKLLTEVGESSRRARFVCEIAVSDPKGNILFTANGICHGSLAEAPRGSNGFGYDPIFIPDGYSQTFGELTDEIKQEISHRARAAKKIIRYLLDFIEV